jgi:GNAT superfamily N-acetyltransferase
LRVPCGAADHGGIGPTSADGRTFLVTPIGRASARSAGRTQVRGPADTGRLRPAIHRSRPRISFLCPGCRSLSVCRKLALPWFVPEVTIRPRIPDDDLQIVAIWARAEPDLPPTSVHEYRYDLENLEPDRLAERWVADLAGTIAGTASLIDFKSVPWGSFHGSVIVDPQHRHQGIGGRLHDHLVASAKTAGATRLHSHVLENDAVAVAFATHRGLTPNGNGDRLSRLDVDTANLEGFEGVEERLRGEGVRIATLAELGAEDAQLMHRLYDLDRAAHQDEPSSIEWEFNPFDVWRRALVRGYGRSADWCWVAMDGDNPVGLSRLKLASSDTAINAFTGVAREYRGRGIARALKLRTIEWSRQNGIRYHFTGNETDNHRMLAINIRLGYQMLPRSIEVALDLSA